MKVTVNGRHYDGPAEDIVQLIAAAEQYAAGKARGRKIAKARAGKKKPGKKSASSAARSAAIKAGLAKKKRKEEREWALAQKGIAVGKAPAAPKLAPKTPKKAKARPRALPPEPVDGAEAAS